MNSSSLIVRVLTFNWQEMGSIDLANLADSECWDPTFRRLATSVRDFRRYGFQNDLAKILLMDLVSLVRQLLCAAHDMRLTVRVNGSCENVITT